MGTGEMDQEIPDLKRACYGESIKCIHQALTLWVRGRQVLHYSILLEMIWIQTELWCTDKVQCNVREKKWTGRNYIKFAIGSNSVLGKATQWCESSPLLSMIYSTAVSQEFSRVACMTPLWAPVKPATFLEAEKWIIFHGSYFMVLQSPSLAAKECFI